MTIIAAAQDSDSIWIGSDSHGHDGNSTYNFGSKLIVRKKLIIGASNSYRVGDLIHENFDDTWNADTIQDIRLIRDKLRDLLLSDGCSSQAASGSTIEHPFSLLIISKFGMWCIESDYQIHKLERGYYAVGVGSDIAFGALRTALKCGCSAFSAVTHALDAAIGHSCFCGGDQYLDGFTSDSDQPVSIFNPGKGE